MGAMTKSVEKKCAPVAKIDAPPHFSIDDETNVHTVMGELPDKVGVHGT